MDFFYIVIWSWLVDWQTELSLWEFDRVLFSKEEGTILLQEHTSHCSHKYTCHVPVGYFPSASNYMRVKLNNLWHGMTHWEAFIHKYIFMNLMIAQVIFNQVQNFRRNKQAGGVLFFFSLIYVWVGTVNYTNKSS